MDQWDLFPRLRGEYCLFVLRGGPRDGQTFSMKFDAPPDTVVEHNSWLPWRRHPNGRWRITADETELSDGRTARVAVYDM